jgi:dTDP-D-glucose 4,6-dehydratase
LVANRDLASQVADLAEKPIQVKTVTAETDRPGHDSSYAPLSHSALAPEWSYTFDEGLRRTVQWTLANPEWIQA